MIKITYEYKGVEYATEFEVRRALGLNGVAFGRPKNAKEWADLGVNYKVTTIADPLPVEPSAEDLAAQELKQKKEARKEAVSRIVVEVDGMMFDGDETSQDRMARTITAVTALGLDLSETKVSWWLFDNTCAEVTVAQLARALRLAGEEQTALWGTPYAE